MLCQGLSQVLGILTRVKLNHRFQGTQRGYTYANMYTYHNYDSYKIV